MKHILSIAMLSFLFSQLSFAAEVGAKPEAMAPANYGRGVGSISEKICIEKNNKMECEKSGLLFYPKCKEGYRAVGCCICVKNK